MDSLSARIRDLQNIYCKWQAEEPSLKIDIDACKSKVDTLNNLFIVWLKKHKEYDYKTHEQSFLISMNFLTQVDDKMQEREKVEARKMRMKNKITNEK